MNKDALTDNNDASSRRQRIDELKKVSKIKRRTECHAQWANVHKAAEYFTDAVTALPNGNSIEAVHSGVHELIRQYTALLLMSVVDAEVFSEFVGKEFLDDTK